MQPVLLHDVIDIGVPAHRPAGDLVRQRRARRHEAAWRLLVPPIPAATIATHFSVHLHRPFTRHRHLAGLWFRRCTRGGGMAEILKIDVENLPAGCIRTGMDTGFGRFPSRVFAINQAWLELALAGIDLIAWTQRQSHVDKCGPSRSARWCGP